MAKALITRWWNSRPLHLSDLYLVLDRSHVLADTEAEEATNGEAQEEELMAVDISDRLSAFLKDAGFVSVVLTDESAFRGMLEVKAKYAKAFPPDLVEELRRLLALAVLLNSGGGA